MKNSFFIFWSNKKDDNMPSFLNRKGELDYKRISMPCAARNCLASGIVC